MKRRERNMIGTEGSLITRISMKTQKNKSRREKIILSILNTRNRRMMIKEVKSNTTLATNGSGSLQASFCSGVSLEL
jgi:hypothetical protein